MTVRPARPNAMAFGTRLRNDSLTGDRSDRPLLAVLLPSSRAPAGHGFPSMGCSQHCFPLRKSGRPDRVESSFESSYPGLKKWSCWPRGSSRPPPRHSPSRPRENHPKTLGKAWVQWDGWCDLFFTTFWNSMPPVQRRILCAVLESSLGSLHRRSSFVIPTVSLSSSVGPAMKSTENSGCIPRRNAPSPVSHDVPGTPTTVPSSSVCPATSSTPGSVNRPTLRRRVASAEISDDGAPSQLPFPSVCPLTSREVRSGTPNDDSTAPASYPLGPGSLSKPQSRSASGVRPRCPSGRPVPLQKRQTSINALF